MPRPQTGVENWRFKECHVEGFKVYLDFGIYGDGGAQVREESYLVSPDLS